MGTDVFARAAHFLRWDVTEGQRKLRWYTQHQTVLCKQKSVCKLEGKRWFVDHHMSGTSNASQWWNPCDDAGPCGPTDNFNSGDLSLKRLVPTRAPTSLRTPDSTLCQSHPPRLHYLTQHHHLPHEILATSPLESTDT